IRYSSVTGVQTCALPIYSGDSGTRGDVEYGDDSPPASKSNNLVRGWAMRLLHLCYAALGFAIARWVFNRHVVAIADPVARFRSRSEERRVGREWCRGWVW